MRGFLIPLAASALAACTESPVTPPSGGGGCRYLGPDEDPAAPPPPGPDANCVVVATINPLSGALGAVGLALENAARLAVRDVNAAGGVGGKKLCLVACDDQTDSATGRPIAQELLDKYPIVAVNGAAASAVSLQVSSVLAPRGVPQISCCSTSPELSQIPELFRTVPSDALQGVALAAVARGLSPPADRVAVIYVDDSYGASLSGVFREAFAIATGTVTAALPYRPGASSYTDVIAHALAQDPRHVLLIAFPTEGAQILRDWRDSGLRPDLAWLATDGLKDDKFAQGAAGLALGTIGTAPLLTGAHYASFEARYKAAFGGEAPGIFTSNQYDAMILIALGIQRAGASASPSAIKDAIQEAARAPGSMVSADDVAAALARAAAGDVDYSGASGELEMDEHGDVISDYSVWQVDGTSIVDRPECWACAQSAGGVRCQEEARCR
ncbi:MAG: ABC transporter substrate-binding protein [Myxococcota bacterium]